VSPSWIERLRSGADGAVGIAIGRREISIVTVPGVKAKRQKMPAAQTLPLAASLFEAEYTASIDETLVQALQALDSTFRHLYVPVHVALPDFVLRSSVFELDDWPRKRSWQQALLRLRFAQEWRRDEASLECQGESLGRAGARHLLWGQGGDRAWLDGVRRALARSGISAWSLNSAATYRFNSLPRTVTAAPGALLSLDPGTWTLLFWDEQARVRQVLTRYIAVSDTSSVEEGALAITDEVERVIRMYAQNENHRVDRLHLCGMHEYVSALTPMFNARLLEPVRLWSPAVVAGQSVAPGLREGWAPLAWAAAMSGEGT